MTKAFDRVDRDILWAKLSLFGYPESLLNAIRNTYRNPTAVVQYKNIYTEAMNMPIGLRQGCVLSPLLFAIYIAELPNHTNKHRHTTLLHK